MKYTVKFTADLNNSDVIAINELFADKIMKEQMLIDIDENSLILEAVTDNGGLW